VLELGFALVLELVAGAARTGALRAAALNHEVRDDSVKRKAVVERFVLLLRRAAVLGIILRAFGQADEVGDSKRRLLEFELADDLALGGVEFGVEAIGEFGVGGGVGHR